MTVDNYQTDKGELGTKSVVWTYVSMVPFIGLLGSVLNGKIEF